MRNMPEHALDHCMVPQAPHSNEDMAPFNDVRHGSSSLPVGAATGDTSQHCHGIRHKQTNHSASTPNCQARPTKTCEAQILCMVEVLAHQFLVGVTKDSFEWSFSRGPNCVVDFFDRSRARRLKNEVHDRNIRGRNPDCNTIEFPVQFWKYEANGLRCTGRRWDH